MRIAPIVRVPENENSSVAREHHKKRVLPKLHQEASGVVEQGRSSNSKNFENISKFLGEPISSILSLRNAEVSHMSGKCPTCGSERTIPWLGGIAGVEVGLCTTVNIEGILVQSSPRRPVLEESSTGSSTSLGSKSSSVSGLLDSQTIRTIVRSQVYWRRHNDND